MEPRYRQQLEAGLQRLDLTVADDVVPRLVQFVELIAKWNRVHNLTAVRNPGDMVTRHLLDSLAVSRWLSGDTVVDVGTGAGLPGIPLALVNLQRRFTLLDSNGKKTRFVTHAVGVLGAANASVVRSRAEDYAPPAPFDTVICRAFAPLPRILEAAGHLCAPHGCILAMKGQRPDDEMSSLPAGWRLDGMHRLEVPGLNSERHLIQLARAGSADL